VVEVDRVTDEALWSAVTDPDGRVRVTKALHPAGALVVGRFVDELFVGEDPTDVLSHVARSGSPASFEATYAGQGRERRVRVHAFAEGDGRTVSGVVHGLHASPGRELDELLGLLTHELSTPLTVIGGYTEMLAERLRDDDGSSTAIAAIERSVQNLNHLIGSLTDARRKPRPVQRERVELVTLLGELRAELEPSLERPMRWDLPAATVLVAGDPVSLRQIVLNLLDNAVKFTPDGTRVEVRLHADEVAARVDVVDHGPGIPGDRVEELFSRFSRLGARRGGLGLGLHQARVIARRHDGDLTYESTPGGGATFVVTVPREEGSEET
jgi:signal transduction histidine kinase